MKSIKQQDKILIVPNMSLFHNILNASIRLSIQNQLCSLRIPHWDYEIPSNMQRLHFRLSGKYDGYSDLLTLINDYEKLITDINKILPFLQNVSEFETYLESIKEARSNMYNELKCSGSYNCPNDCRGGEEREMYQLQERMEKLIEGRINGKFPLPFFRGKTIDTVRSYLNAEEELKDILDSCEKNKKIFQKMIDVLNTSSWNLCSNLINAKSTISKCVELTENEFIEIINDLIEEYFTVNNKNNIRLIDESKGEYYDSLIDVDDICCNFENIFNSLNRLKKSLLFEEIKKVFGFKIGIGDINTRVRMEFDNDNNERMVRTMINMNTKMCDTFNNSMKLLSDTFKKGFHNQLCKDMGVPVLDHHIQEYLYKAALKNSSYIRRSDACDGSWRNPGMPTEEEDKEIHDIHKHFQDILSKCKE